MSPQTPFQWVSCDTPEQIHLKQDLLKRELRDKNIKLTWTRPEDTLLEAWLTRGDRKVSDVIYTCLEEWRQVRCVERPASLWQVEASLC